MIVKLVSAMIFTKTKILSVKQDSKRPKKYFMYTGSNLNFWNSVVHLPVWYSCVVQCLVLGDNWEISRS